MNSNAGMMESVKRARVAKGAAMVAGAVFSVGVACAARKSRGHHRAPALDYVRGPASPAPPPTTLTTSPFT